LTNNLLFIFFLFSTLTLADVVHNTARSSWALEPWRTSSIAGVRCHSLLLTGSCLFFGAHHVLVCACCAGESAVALAELVLADADPLLARLQQTRSTDLLAD
jgi:hypothetical protein